jgi:hypothetical protein
MKINEKLLIDQLCAIECHSSYRPLKGFTTCFWRWSLPNHYNEDNALALNMLNVWPNYSHAISMTH